MTVLRLSVLATTTLLLGACASHAPIARVTPAGAPVSVPPLSADARRIAQNEEYIAMVERVARRRGIVVQWVHPPTTVLPAGQ